MSGAPLVVFTDTTDLPQEPAADLLRGAGFETASIELDRGLPADVRHACALVVGFARVEERHLSRLPNLRIIASTSSGTDMIDVDAARRRGVTVVNVPDAAVEDVAVHALTLTLAAERGIVSSREIVAGGGWTPECRHVPRRPSELTLGLLGFGRIARRLAELAAPLVGRILTHDPARPVTPPNVRSVSFDELLAHADVLSLHAPVTDATRGMIDRRALERLPVGAGLVNTARAELVDEIALRDALDAGTLAWAALDVFGGEPPSPDHPFRRHPAVVASPHVGYRSVASLDAYVLDPARAIIAGLA